MGVKVNLSAFTKLEQALKNSNGKKLDVGWFESARYDDSTPVAGVAAVQEFGSPKMNIPPRPFMRPTIADKQKDWEQMIGKGSESVLKGNISINNMLGVVGTKVVADIKNTITSSNYPALSPITIALRRIRDDGGQVSGKLVGMVAGAIASGETGPGQLGDQSYSNKDPLRDTGLMIATLTSEVH